MPSPTRRSFLASSALGAGVLAFGVPGKFVLCVGEQMRADEDEEVTFGNGVYRYKRTPLPEEVAKVAALVAGITEPEGRGVGRVSSAHPRVKTAHSRWNHEASSGQNSPESPALGSLRRFPAFRVLPASWLHYSRLSNARDKVEAV